MLLDRDWSILRVYVLFFSIKVQERVFTINFPTVFKLCRHRVNASSNLAPVTFFTVFKMCWHRVNAVLDEKILFGKITRHLELEIRIMPVRGLYGNRIFHVPFWSMIYVALKLIL